MGELSARAAAEEWYGAFLAADRGALAKVVASSASWVIPLDTVLSGSHHGPNGMASLREQIAELTDGTWQPLRDDSVDIAASVSHAVIMDRYVDERSGRRLDSHEAVILAVECGYIARVFHYLHDPVSYAEFWAR